MISDTRIRLTPRLFGPVLNKCGKFPYPVTLDMKRDTVPQIIEHVNRFNRRVKLVYKKSSCNINIAVGSLLLKPKELVLFSAIFCR